LPKIEKKGVLGGPKSPIFLDGTLGGGPKMPKTQIIILKTLVTMPKIMNNPKFGVRNCQKSGFSGFQNGVYYLMIPHPLVEVGYSGFGILKLP
jgi:hypothetical protein